MTNDERIQELRRSMRRTSIMTAAIIVIGAVLFAMFMAWAIKY